MTLSEEARERLADLVELQPTKNADLQERWGLDSGSEVHAYLESELDEYYFRNEDSLICATPAAEAMVGDGGDTDGPRSVSVSSLQRSILDELPGPDDDPQSVVATLHDLRDAGLADVEVDDVRSALHRLSDRGLVERVRMTVPTFRLALPRDGIDIEVTDTDESDEADDADGDRGDYRGKNGNGGTEGNTAHGQPERDEEEAAIIDDIMNDFEHPPDEDE